MNAVNQNWFNDDTTTSDELGNSFDELYNSHAQKIYRLGWAILQNNQAAEDVVQETFLRAYKARKQFNPKKASIGTWLYQIALNYCRSQLRRKRFFSIPWANQAVPFNHPSTISTGPEKRLLQIESQQVLWQAVQSLSHPLKEVITLHYYMELPAVKIATILNCPEGTVYSRLYNARQKLAKSLTKSGLTIKDMLEVEHAA